jgi:cation diffusion facilitator family transporter
MQHRLMHLKPKIMDKKKASYLEGTVSIFVNIGLFFIKYWAGIVSGSVALIADAWHTLSDSISSVIVIAGTRLSAKGPDKQHPFGHGRWEHLASISIGILLGVIAFDLIKESIHQFKIKESANFGTIAVVVTIISIGLKEVLAQYAFFLGRKTDNATVKADGWHHRTDALSSLVILIGILFKDKFWWIDSVLGFVVSMMLLYAAYEIIKESINKIIGESPSPELVKEVENIIERLDLGNVFPHHYHIHNYVSHKELSFHIRLEGNKSIQEGHLIVEAIERNIYDKLCISATIHVDPDIMERMGVDGS